MILLHFQTLMTADCEFSRIRSSELDDHVGSHDSRRRCQIGRELGVLLARVDLGIRRDGSYQGDIEALRISADKNRRKSRDVGISTVQVEDFVQAQDQKLAVFRSKSCFLDAESRAPRSGQSYSNQRDQMSLFRHH